MIQFINAVGRSTFRWILLFVAMLIVTPLVIAGWIINAHLGATIAIAFYGLGAFIAVVILPGIYMG